MSAFKFINLPEDFHDAKRMHYCILLDKGGDTHKGSYMDGRWYIGDTRADQENIIAWKYLLTMGELKKASGYSEEWEKLRNSGSQARLSLLCHK